MRFDRVIVLDWSAASAPSPRRPSADAIWIGRDGTIQGETYHRTRSDATAMLLAEMAAARTARQRLLIGADFPFGYPAGFARALTGRDGALAVWDWLAAHVVDGPDNANNRFALAAGVNARLGTRGPFWGRPTTLVLPYLPDKGRGRIHPFPERRMVEKLHPRAQPVWKLFTTGSVGSQALLGIPVMARLRAAGAAVWPLESLSGADVVLAEVWPSILADAVRAAIGSGSHRDGDIKDQVQVRLLARALAGLGDLAPLLSPDAPADVLHEEGWILGTGHAAALRAAL
jgi:molybdopterin-guanine dinucleotide biosynthesis protein B